MRTTLLMLAMLCTAAGAVASDGHGFFWNDVDETDDGCRRGFYCGLGVSRIEFDPDLDARSIFSRKGIDLDGYRDGEMIILGWGFGPHFTSEIRLMTFVAGGRTADVKPLGAVFAWDSMMPITDHGRLRPFLAAGFGGLALIYDSRSETDRGNYAVTGNFGGGLLMRLLPRTYLALDVRFVLLNFEREQVNIDDDDDTIHIGGGGSMHYLTLSLTYDF